MQFHYPTHPRFVDLTGQRFGRLVAVGPVGSRKKGGTIWRMACDCGQSLDADGANIRYGRTTSCGCLQHEKRLEGNNLRHGMSSAPEHVTWMAMRGRCENPNNHAYMLYGGRGIYVCERWQTFENFLADMGERPANTSIDRIDNDGPYSPENCRWATQKEQVRNRRNSLAVEHNGKMTSLADLGNMIGVPYKAMHHRYTIGKRGSDLTAPLRVVAKGVLRKHNHVPPSPMHC